MVVVTRTFSLRLEDLQLLEKITEKEKKNASAIVRELIREKAKEIGILETGG